MPCRVVVDSITIVFAHNNYTAKRYTLLKDFLKEEFNNDN